jgi:hypothetical protein
MGEARSRLQRRQVHRQEALEQRDDAAGFFGVQRDRVAHRRRDQRHDQL